MCGGACPSGLVPSHSGLRPVSWGIAPTSFPRQAEGQRPSANQAAEPQSRNQSQLFSQLHCLGSAPGAQLVEQATGMRLDGVFADKEFFGDLTIAQAVGNQLEDLQLATGNAKLGQSLLVQSKELRRRHLPNDDRFLVFGEFESQPDTQHGEKQRDQSAIDFDGVLNDQEAILDQLQDDDQSAAAETVD